MKNTIRARMDRQRTIGQRQAWRAEIAWIDRVTGGPARAIIQEFFSRRDALCCALKDTRLIAEKRMKP